MYMVGAQSLPRWLATSLVPSRQCPWCVTHLTVMASEPLTLFIGSFASSAIPVFVHWARNIGAMELWLIDCFTNIQLNTLAYMLQGQLVPFTVASRLHSLKWCRLWKAQSLLVAMPGSYPTSVLMIKCLRYTTFSVSTANAFSDTFKLGILLHDCGMWNWMRWTWFHACDAMRFFSLSCSPSSNMPSWLSILQRNVLDVEDWFNMYLGHLQYVSWCTNVWFMFMHVDVTIGYMTFLA